MSLDPARTVPDMPTYSEPIVEEMTETTETITSEITTIAESSSFYNSDGVFILESPKTITITQGDGKKADITLYKKDTVYDIVEKINSAISETLGQKKYVDNKSKFCNLADGTEATSESVAVRDEISRTEETEDKEIPPDSDILSDTVTTLTTKYNMTSTILIRSSVPGKEGELYFSGDDDLLNALGLNTIRESSETRYTASIYDAHSGRAIAKGVKTTGNVIHSAIHNVDIEFDAMAGINSSWDENTKRYIFSGGDYSATLHLKDNGITFQTGANDGEDFTIQLGDMSSQALGISSVNVATRETASRSMAVIDSAISRVSSQRAKIGAYQNALEHTSESLTVTTANLMESESRIRDADMADYMMDFVRLQILNQSGTSMLSQANQLPQSVLSLLGN